MNSKDKKIGNVNMTIVSIRLNREEEDAVKYRMKIGGETVVSAHIKRVYFEGGKQDNEQLGRIQKQLDMLTESSEQIEKTMRHIQQAKTDDTELTLLAALYILLYPSVEPAIRAKADKYIKAEVVEKFLEKKGEKS